MMKGFIVESMTAARYPYSFYMQETVNWSSELTLSREKVVMSEEYSIADSKQTEFGFGVDAQTEDPLRPDSPCPSGLSA